MGYRKEILDTINNLNYTFYKLYVDDKCLFDDFVDDISDNKIYMKELRTIYAYMDYLGSQKIPNTKFNSIVDSGRSDLFEFKSKHLRVYVILIKPSVYVVAGGYKTTQKKDIARFKKKIVRFHE